MKTVKTQINCGITLSEYAGGIRFGTDALLLSSFCPKSAKCADLGAGSGAIGLLLLASGKAKYVTGVEISPEYARLANENAASNGFEKVYSCIECDVSNIRSALPAGEYGLCVSNPPYLPAKSGIENPSGLKHAAFHETTADIDVFCAAASYIIKFGGSFCCVYRPEYIQRLVSGAHKNAMALKRLRFVHPDTASPASLVLAEFRKGGKDGARVMPPLVVYTDNAHTVYTDEMRRTVAM